MTPDTIELTKTLMLDQGYLITSALIRPDGSGELEIGKVTCGRLTGTRYFVGLDLQPKKGHPKALKAALAATLEQVTRHLVEQQTNC